MEKSSSHAENWSKIAAIVSASRMSCRSQTPLLREVGSTNRTRVADYERAITRRPSCCCACTAPISRITGFTEQPAIEELAALARARRHSVDGEDLGSGALFDLRTIGVRGEPACWTVCSRRRHCRYSGDKLLAPTSGYSQRPHRP